MFRLFPLLLIPQVAFSQETELRFQSGWESEYRRNFDLEGGKRDDTTAHELSFRATVEAQPADRIRAYLEAEAVFDRERRQDEARETAESLRINQAYLAFDLGGSELTLGRFLMRDDREWLVDENLDGLRLRHEGERARFDLSVSRVDMWHRDLLDSHSTGDSVNNFIALADFQIGEAIWLGGYAVLRDDRSGQDGRPVHFGLRSHGELAEGLSYWADLSAVRGNDGEMPLRGHAVTAGATYRLASLPAAPRLTLGYAWASGDDDPGDNRNTAFRQTGLQSNEGRLGDGGKLHYYGEAFDPELSNMAILTAAIGANPTEALSLDLVYNHFRQVEAADSLRDAALDADPDGNSRELGQELDLVLTYEPEDDWEIQAALGWFRPGNAFRHADGRRADGALHARLELEYRF